jgi:DHA2 family multidrug resistance protein
VLLLIFSRVPVERVQLIGSAVFYPAILSSIVLVAFMAGVVLEYTDWKMTYYCLIGLQLFTLLITLLMLKPHAGHRRFPLYQVDWAGFILFACSLLTVAYTFIYGSKYYWFHDPRICYSSGMAAIAIVLFLYRQSMLKRPLIQLGVFRSIHFVTGLCLLAVYYGGKDSINLVYNYAFGMLKWSPVQVISLGICNLAGMIGLAVLSTQLMIRRKLTIQYFLVTGFGLLGLFNVWMWFVLTPDLSFTDLLIPMFLQGAASGLLFVPIIMYMLTSAPGFSGTTGIVLAACTRFTATLNSMAGLYNLQLYYNQYFREGFLGYMTADSQNTMERLNTYRSVYVSKGFSPEQGSDVAFGAVWQNLGQQSQLLTNRAIFMTFAMLLLGTAILVLFVPATTKTWQHWKLTIRSYHAL